MDSVHKGVDVYGMLNATRSFEAVEIAYHNWVKKMDAEMKALFPLIKKVLKKGGILRLEVTEARIPENLRRLKQFGFDWVKPRKLKQNETQSRWGKIYHHHARFDSEKRPLWEELSTKSGYQPFEILAVLK